MAIQDDFTIFPKTKVIRHNTGSSTVYTAVSFYSYLQDAFDEPGFLSYEIPIRFNTPTSFTMLNGWFLDDGDGSNILQFLTGGGIDTLNYGIIADPVVMIDLDYSMSSFVANSLDETVVIDGSPMGPLLSYKDDYPDASTARIWVRDTNSLGSTVPGQNAVVAVGGDYLTSGYSASGDNIYHNLFTIAAFAGTPNPQLYIYQNHPSSGLRVRIAEWSSFANWDRGSIDILVTTQLAGTLIDGGNITTFVRETGDTFTFVESTLTTSGRTPIATETASDTVNIVEGEFYLLIDGSTSTVSVDFTAGDVIQDTSTSDLLPPTWYAEVVSVTQFTATKTGLLSLRALRGTILDGDIIYVGATQSAVTNGTPGDTLISYTGTDATTLGQTITAPSGAIRLLRGIDSGQKRYVCQDDPTVTGAGRNGYYRDYVTSEALTGGTDGNVGTTSAVSTSIISGFNDITVAHMNGTVPVDTFAGTFIEGERITWTGGEAIMVQTDGAAIMMLGNVTSETNLNVINTTITGDISAATCDISSTAGMTDDNTQNFEFPLQTTGALYSVFIEGGSIYQIGRSLTDIYSYLQYYVRDGQSISDRIIYTSNAASITQLAAEEYIKADAAYAATKPAPFGTLAGGVFFGATAVWLSGMQSSDANNIKLTDTNAAKTVFTLREPDTTITITVSNTKVDDRIAIFLEAGSTGLPDKAQYFSDPGANGLNGTTFQVVSGAFPKDTPTVGTFIVVDNALNKQHRYRFASRNGTSAPGTFTMPTELTGTTTAGSGSEVLIDTAALNFPGVQVGDIIHRKNNSLGFAYVTSIALAASNTLSTTLIEDTSGVATAAWANTGDTYSIFSLVKQYTGTDTFFIPYMDTIENADGSVIVSLTFVTTRNIILEVRNVEAATEIIPFKTTGTITNTGYTQGVIRNEDTVFTP